MGNINFEGIMPNERLSSLRRMIQEKGFVRIMEAHNGLTGRIVETISAERDGETVTFDGMWVSSLCDSTAKQMTEDFMCIARIESLILKQGMEDALERAHAFVAAGADGIMIHSKEKEPDEIVEFLKRFKAEHPLVPVVVVPTSYNTITEEELKGYGVNVVIYANHFIRSAYPAMVGTARSILENQRAAEADHDYCMSIKEILTLIPDSL